jgi:flagellar hook-basal body complex protein FliE
MALEETVTSLEGIDEAFHDLYVEKDGKFNIDISGLKSALTKERTTRKTLEKKLNTGNEEDPPDVEELKVQLKQANNSIKSMKVTSKVKNTALAAGVDADYVDDVITLTKGNFSLNSDGDVIMVDADGEPTGKSVSNFFKADFKKAKPRYYSGSGKQGSGAQQNLGNEGPLSFNGKLEKAKRVGNLQEMIRLKQSKIK